MRKRIRRLYDSLVIAFLSKSDSRLDGEWGIEDNEEFSRFRDFLDGQVLYRAETFRIAPSSREHKWVGAQFYDGAVLAAPNDEVRVLKFTWEDSYFGSVREGLFKWTGGCIWDGLVYFFPRAADSFLRIKDDRVEEVPLSIKYGMEHHYSGVCTEGGVVYQPPRDTNHILKTDLRTGESSRIDIVDKKYRVDFRYCGSIIHPNGFIYFFPEVDNRVIKLDPVTDKWCFIGNKISTMCFDAKIGLDGNIYGYSAYRRGIMKIKVPDDVVEMVHEEISPGAYGTKYGADGCLYSVPGDGSMVYRFEVLRDRIEPFFDLENGMKAKYAGGLTAPDGTIVCIPAEENAVLLFVPEKKVSIPETLYSFFFVDNY